MTGPWWQKAGKKNKKEEGAAQKHGMRVRVPGELAVNLGLA